MQWIQCDVVYEHKTHEPEWTLTIADEQMLVHTPLRMVTHHTPHGFVPVRLTYVGDRARLHYDVTGLRTLAHVLRDGRDRRQWEALLISMAQRVHTCRAFLIDECELMLHPEYVYVKGNDVIVACVPLRSCADQSMKWGQWQAMCAMLTRYGIPHDIMMRITPDQWDEATFAHALWAQAIRDMPVTDAQHPHRNVPVQDVTQTPVVRSAVQDKGSFWQSCRAWITPRTSARTAPHQDIPMHERTTMMTDVQQTTLLGGIRPLTVHVQIDDTEPYVLNMTTSPFVVGREDADHVIGKRSISRRHVAFAWVAGQWTVRDCGSVNGSWHNDRMLTDDRAMPYVPGDIVRIPGATLTYV